jgi:hypothetical protein
MEHKAVIEGTAAATSQISLGGVLRIPAVRQVPNQLNLPK